MTLTDYLIECSRNTDITVTDLSEVLVELKRIGNNINQIARKINSKRFFLATSIQSSKASEKFTTRFSI